MILTIPPDRRDWPSHDILCFVLGVATGAALWVLPAKLGDKVEAWDSSYWWVWLGGTAIASVILGYLEPYNWWRWPFVLVGAQFLALFVQNPALGSLAPVGIVLLLVFATFNLLPCGVGAALGVWQSRMRLRGAR